MICKKHFCQANGAFDDPEWDDFRCVLRKFMNFFTLHHISRQHLIKRGQSIILGVQYWNENSPTSQPEAAICYHWSFQQRPPSATTAQQQVSAF